MVCSCSVRSCKNRHVKGHPRQFFQYPIKNKAVLELWERALGNDYCFPTKYSKICSDHFTRADYLVRPGILVKRLKPDAIPSLRISPGEMKKEKANPAVKPPNDIPVKVTVMHKPPPTKRTVSEIKMPVEDEEPSMSTVYVKLENEDVFCLKSDYEDPLECYKEQPHSPRSTVLIKVENEEFCNQNPAMSPDWIEYEHEDTPSTTTACEELPIYPQYRFMSIGTQTIDSDGRGSPTKDQLRRKIKSLKQTLRRKDARINILLSTIKQMNTGESMETLCRSSSPEDIDIDSIEDITMN